MVTVFNPFVSGSAALYPLPGVSEKRPRMMNTAIAWGQDFVTASDGAPATLACAECPPGTPVHSLWAGAEGHLVFTCSRCARGLCRVAVAFG